MTSDPTTGREDRGPAFTVGSNTPSSTTPPIRRYPAVQSAQSGTYLGGAGTGGISTQASGSGSSRHSSIDERTSLLLSAGTGGGRAGGGGEGEDRPIRRSFTEELDDGSLITRNGPVEDGLKTSDGQYGSSGSTPRPGVLDRNKSATMAVARKIKRRSKYYVPVTDWLPKYNLSLFSGDLVAGVSIACLLIPQSMSYASGLAKLNPVAGLWSASIPAIIYGILGTCRQLSLGPESALCLIIGQMIQDKVYGDPHALPEHPELEAAAISLMTTAQCCVITLALGLLRLGFLDVVLSRALLRGFITAVAVILVIEQTVPMFGLEAIITRHAPHQPLPKLIFIASRIKHLNPITAGIAFTSLVILILTRVAKGHVVQRPGGRWVKYVPEILIVVVAATILTGVFRWDEKGVQVLGKINAGIGNPFGPPLRKRQWKYFNYTFPTACVSAVIGIVDSVVAARENGSKYGYAVSANRDLVALGVSNLVASTLTATGGVPVYGSITRSRLNGLIGARTQMSSIITAACMILSIFFLLPYLYFLPKAVLAAIICLVVYAILADAPEEVQILWRMRAWTDFAQMTGTFFLTIIFSIETGLIASVVFSLILVIQNSTQTRIKIIGRLPNSDEWVPIDEDESAQEDFAGVLVIRIRENLNFANTGQLKERLRRLELYGPQKSHPSDEPRRESAKAVIIHMGDVEEMDASAVQILHEFTKAYTERGVGIHFAHLHPKQVDNFHIVGITDLCGPSHFHRDLRDAMKAIESLGYGQATTSRFA